MESKCGAARSASSADGSARAFELAVATSVEPARVRRARMASASLSRRIDATMTWLRRVGAVPDLTTAHFEAAGEARLRELDLSAEERRGGFAGAANAHVVAGD